VRGAEPVFAPASPIAGETEGWVISMADDEASGRSQLRVIDAQHFDAPPVAVVRLPRRVPYGAHGTSVADSALE